MRFWWVNQNQTFRQEMSGGYLWSPKRNSNGGHNPFYEFMREVAPGDLVLSYEGAHIRAVGIVQSYCYECPKPAEFGSAGTYWEKIGWKVDVSYRQLTHQLRPSDHINELGPLLPSRYSPLQTSGRGNQGVYLTELPTSLMEAIAQLVGQELILLMKASKAEEPQAQELTAQGIGLLEWEEHLQEQIATDGTLPETEKHAVILARRGQGLFKERVRKLERYCRITKVDRLEHLRASHIKPWRDSDNQERLAGENGLLLTPSIDHLFDRGFISFEDNGRLLISPVAHKRSLERMGVPVDTTTNVGNFSEEQKRHLDFHRNSVFLESHRS